MDVTIIIKILGVVLAGKVISSVPVLLAVGLLMRLILSSTPKYEKATSFNKCVVIIGEIFTLFMYLKFGISLMFIKYVSFLLILFFASICDIKERKLATYLSVMVLLTGFIGVNMQTICFNFFAMLVSFAFMFACGLLSGSHIGGADIKFVPACFFVLGATRGLTGLMLGLSFALIGTFIRNKTKNITDSTERQTMPLIPYLSVAYVLTSII